MSETATALTLGLPYIVDFSAGICSFVLAFTIFDYEDKKEE